MRRRALATSVIVLASLLGAGATAAPASAADKGFHRQAASDVPLLRSDAPLPRHRAGLRTYTARDGSSGTVVPSVVTPPKSTWQVSYAGFTSQQQAAFQAAVDIWAGIISSPVPITVNANLEPTPAGLLGFAGPGVFYQDPSLGDGSSFYPSALSDALVGYDIDNATPDIEATFSSSEPQIYYGTDGLPPTGYVDFETVVLHELGHGLGFTGSAWVDPATGRGSFDGPLIYDTFNANSAGSPLLTSVANDSTAMKTALTNGSVFWNGPNATLANGGTRPELYAPNPWEDGSSIAHLDEDVYPAGNANSLMTPYLQEQEVVRGPGAVTVGVLADMGWKAAPGAPTNVTGDYGDQSVRVSWKAPPANGSPITSYDVTISDGVTTTHQSASGSATSAMVTGLTNATPYTFTVTAVNAIGSSAPSAGVAVTPHPDVTAPTAINNAPQTWSRLAAGSIAFGGTDPDRPTAVLSYQCSFDGAPLAPCTSPATYSGYLNGSTHTFSLVATDEAGNLSTQVDRTWTVDLTLPSVTPRAVPTFSLASIAGLSWAGADTGSGIASYDMRYRSAPFYGTFGGFVYPSVWQATTATSKALTAYRGYTYCFSVRARDTAGNLTAWSAERCTGMALDDRAMAASYGWSRWTQSGYYMNTVSGAGRAGVTLARTSIQTRQIAIVATNCPGCGVLGVYWNGVLVRKLTLNSPRVYYRHLIGVVTFPSARYGTLVIKTLNSGPVRIDGLALNRT